MALSNEDILNAIAEMSVMDVVELVSAMEEKFGVSAQAAVAVAAAPAAGCPPALQHHLQLQLVEAVDKRDKVKLRQLRVALQDGGSLACPNGDHSRH